MQSACPAPSIHVLTVTLLEITPPVWRRLEVPSDVTLARLHRILQVAMGWENTHPHEFAVGDDRFGDGWEHELVVDAVCPRAAT